MASPDGILKATLFVRDCGATTSFTSIVNVQRLDEKFKADDGRIFVAEGQHNIVLEWRGPRTLNVKCGSCFRKYIFLENVALGDIDISYSLGDSK